MDFKKYLDCNSKKLLTVENISNSIYETLLLNSRSPVLIKNGAENWPAMKKWSLDFFKSQDGAENVKVFVEKGNVMQNETQFERVSFCDYLNLLEKPSQNHLGLIPYLSVFEAFSIFSHLNDDVDFSMLTRYRFKNKMKCWFGPKGTVTGYHIDWSDNVLAQIKGRKLVKLVSPSQSKYMYPSKKYDPGSLLSQVDSDNYNENDYPLFSKVNSFYVVLNPGDMLYIPRGWWHYVRALDSSISVNCFSSGLKTMLLDSPREKIKRKLHDLGLYGADSTLVSISSFHHTKRDNLQ